MYYNNQKPCNICLLYVKLEVISSIREKVQTHCLFQRTCWYCTVAHIMHQGCNEYENILNQTGTVFPLLAYTKV